MFKNQKKHLNQNGFSLLETVVSMFIFGIITLSATAIFQMVVEAQRSALAAQNIQASLRYALEVMSKEIRNAQSSSGECTPNVGLGDDGNIYSALNNGGNPVSAGSGIGTGVQLAFKNKYDECVKYFLNNGVIQITRDNGTAITKPITPASINVTKLEFKVMDDGTSTTLQPRVTILIEAEVNSGKYKQPMSIQTTVSSRYYN